MIKRLVMISLLGTVAVLLVLGWFGYRAYVNITDGIAYRQHFEAVANGDLPSPDQPAGHGMYPITKLRVKNVAKGQLEALVADRGCDTVPDSVTADVVADDRYIAVLIHAPAQWLPDVGEWWGEVSRMFSGSGCSGVGRLQWVPVSIGGPLAGRPVIDAVTGQVVYPAR